MSPLSTSDVSRPTEAGNHPRWSECIFDAAPPPGPSGTRVLVGVLRGEGIGPEIIECALEVLRATAATAGLELVIEFGGTIGRQAESHCGKALPLNVVDFCSGIFSRGGAILSGPAGGRYVYDLRTRFDLFCKLSPIVVTQELTGAGRMQPGHTSEVDILVVREAIAGLYQGQWELTEDAGKGRLGRHTFSYSEAHVRRVVLAAARLARLRRRALTVVYKEAGAPSISELWRDCAREISAANGVACQFLDVDYAAYRLLQYPREFDVVVAPNLFGDILCDLGGVLLGSRALTYGGNFSPAGAAFYQTNHGAAFDLAGTDRANPMGQILSVAMLLRESFGHAEAAETIFAAIRSVWREGWRTADLLEDGCRVVGTREMGTLVVEAVLAQTPLAR